MTRRLLTVAGVIIAVMWVMKNPAGAAADVHQFFNALSAFVAAL
jgi:hypothetical protein